VAAGSSASVCQPSTLRIVICQGEQRPEQHGCSLGRGQHGLSLDPRTRMGEAASVEPNLHDRQRASAVEGGMDVATRAGPSQVSLSASAMSARASRAAASRLSAGMRA
jgi:hypothetical protein